MESANLQQLQGQLVGSASASLSSYGVSSSSPHSWTQNITLSTTGNLNGIPTNPRQKNEATSIPNSLNSSMVQQDSGFSWNINNNNAASVVGISEQHDHDLQQINKIKEEDRHLSDHNPFPKFTEMLSNSENPDEQKYMTDLSEKLLLKTISSGFPINGGHHHHHPFSPSQLYSTYGSSMAPGRGNFSQIYPSINISNLNRSPQSPISGSFDMNLQALDLLTSPRFSGSVGHPDNSNNLSVYKDNISYDLDRLQNSNHLPLACNPNKLTSSSFFANEITEAKRPNSSLMEPGPTPSQAAPKKSRLESRASCPPFKVRKEKLGDRIAALQQLVAPFGKTDTASVLMEAIGYIKFLQNQVETLSVPYMKSSRNKSSRNGQVGSSVEEGNEEAKRDLRSRGLCLVPLSCMSYVTGEAGVGGSGGGIWPPPNFGGT